MGKALGDRVMRCCLGNGQIRDSDSWTVTGARSSEGILSSFSEDKGSGGRIAFSDLWDSVNVVAQ